MDGRSKPRASNAQRGPAVSRQGARPAWPNRSYPRRHKATRRDWIGLAVIAIPCLIYSMDLTVLNLAVPQITADLKPSARQLLWIVDIYGFMVAGALVTMGTLGDRVGRRKRAADRRRRVRRHLGARRLFDQRRDADRRARAAGPRRRRRWRHRRSRSSATCSSTAGSAPSPSAYGSRAFPPAPPSVRWSAALMLAHFWWGSVFLINVPIMLCCWSWADAAARIPRPECRPHGSRSAPRNRSWPCWRVIFGIKRMAEDGWALLPIVSIAGRPRGRRDVLPARTRLADPLIDVWLFARRPSARRWRPTCSACSWCSARSCSSRSICSSCSAWVRWRPACGRRPRASCSRFGSMAAPMLVRNFQPCQRHRHRAVVVGASASRSLTQIGVQEPVAAARRDDGVLPRAVADRRHHHRPRHDGGAARAGGAASAISETSFEFGGALGIAVLGSLFTFVYGRGACLPRTTARCRQPQSSGRATASARGRCGVDAAERTRGAASGDGTRGVRLCLRGDVGRISGLRRARRHLRGDATARRRGR